MKGFLFYEFFCEIVMVSVIFYGFNVMVSMWCKYGLIIFGDVSMVVWYDYLLFGMNNVNIWIFVYVDN